MVDPVLEPSAVYCLVRHALIVARAGLDIATVSGPWGWRSAWLDLC